MSLGSALNTAVSALSAQSAAISSVSQNIANASTTAYKTSDVSFQSLVTGAGGTTSGASGSVTYSIFQNMYSQGSVSATDVNTNLAISGDGFFVVTGSTDDTTSTDYNYTRNGSFSTDADGYLVNSEGYYLMGQPTDAEGNVLSTASGLSSLELIDVNEISGTAKATTEVSLNANLPADAEDGSTYTTSYEVIDSLGVSHTVGMTWTKSTTNENEWEVSLDDPYQTNSSGSSSGTISPNTLTLTFNTDGSLATTTPDPLEISISGLSTGGADSTFALNVENVTQYASNADTPQIDDFTATQDGMTYGELSSIDISDDGLVSASFTNGMSIALYQLQIATFSNPNGLTQVNGTIYDENEAAGSVTLNNPGDGSAGSITSSALELSTTDTADEFSRMIIAQQAYSAASQVITTTTEMFDTLISATR